MVRIFNKFELKTLVPIFSPEFQAWVFFMTVKSLGIRDSFRPGGVHSLPGFYFNEQNIVLPFKIPGLAALRVTARAAFLVLWMFSGAVRVIIPCRLPGRFSRKKRSVPFTGNKLYGWPGVIGRNK